MSCISHFCTSGLRTEARPLPAEGGWRPWEQRKLSCGLSALIAAVPQGQKYGSSEQSEYKNGCANARVKTKLKKTVRKDTTNVKLARKCLLTSSAERENTHTDLLPVYSAKNPSVKLPRGKSAHCTLIHTLTVGFIIISRVRASADCN